MISLFGGLLPLLILGGLVFAVIQGLRSAAGAEGEPLEPAEVAKSFALHLGLFVALIGCAVGLIDLFQSMVDEGERLAGNSADLARGLSLLIVAAPAFTLLLRAVGKRSDQRRAGGDRLAMRGWTAYLVVALTVTLIALLVSVGQVASDLTAATREVDADEVVQLVVWLGLWLGHWFVLRPWLGVRGDAHLAIGSIAGLVWFLSGAGAVIYRVLDSGYTSAIDTGLDSSFGIGVWLIVGGTGAVVWVWHWVVALDAAPPGRAVEGSRRTSPLWFFTVVVAGILPALVAIVVAITTMISGVLIWFFGTTDQSAADYFRPATGLVAVLFIGFVTWAFHRWVLDAHGLADGVSSLADGVSSLADGVSSRNESIRFHDYVVVTVGLVAVIGAAAALVALAIDTLATPTLFAGTDRSDNMLIILLTVLVAGASLWWFHWGVISSARATAPVDECDSFWRKLYLIVSFGLGGLVFGIGLIGVLFAFLRDLLDGALGRGTLADVANPIGWAVAVVAAVWYHFGVWQADRTVLEVHRALAPPPPTVPPPTVPPPTVPPPTVPPPPGASAVRSAPAGLTPTSVVASVVGLSIRPATRADIGELFTLQMADRASRLAQGSSVPEHPETFGQMQTRLDGSDFTVITDGDRIIGFVTRPLDVDATVEIQVVVAPDRNTGGVVDLLASAFGPGGPTS